MLSLQSGSERSWEQGDKGQLVLLSTFAPTGHNAPSAAGGHKIYRLRSLQPDNGAIDGGLLSRSGGRVRGRRPLIGCGLNRRGFVLRRTEVWRAAGCGLSLWVGALLGECGKLAHGLGRLSRLR